MRQRPHRVRFTRKTPTGASLTRPDRLDYTGISDTARANLAISHSDSSLTVSRSEAERLESESKSRLLRANKLSLIVDLDQTIVHATVDPTVGEWMDDAGNPNYEALKGVGRFQLADPAPPGGAPAKPPDASDGCWYYLKQRCAPSFRERRCDL